MPQDYYQLATLDEAARITGKTAHNIRDYIQRGRIKKYNPEGELVTLARNGELRVSLKELKKFLSQVEREVERHHHDGLNEALGFYHLAERERTKHVHRLHPYLGKFIPQLVEWFLARYFKPGDVVLDPFMGSGTTLVQGNESGLHTIGIDVSPFNCMIARAKTANYDVACGRADILDAERRVTEFSRRLMANADGLLPFGDDEIERMRDSLFESCESEYLQTWFAPRALIEMLFYRELIPQYENQELLKVLLTRAVRSSRLIPHFDLATPKAPIKVGEVYWCRKHNRDCKPIENCVTKIHAYSEDTARRIAEFDRLRSDKSVTVIQGDSREVNLNEYLDGRMLDGVFTSPPYVGQIDYHDQHTYAYELLGLPRHDGLEIGPKRSGKSKRAQAEYVEGIAAVFRHLSRWLNPGAKVFIVANDRFKLYPLIAEKSGLKIAEEFYRAVTKRTEQGDDPYHETIFMMVKCQ